MPAGSTLVGMQLLKGYQHRALQVHRQQGRHGQQKRGVNHWNYRLRILEWKLKLGELLGLIL